MKKAFKIYLWAWGAWLVFVTIFVAGICLLSSLSSSQNTRFTPQNIVRDKILKLDKDPDNIEEIINIDLPNIVNVEGSGVIYDLNDTTRLNGDCYTYKLEFEKPLSDTLFSKLLERVNIDCDDTLSYHWSYFKDTLSYHEWTGSYKLTYVDEWRCDYNLYCKLYRTGINVFYSESLYQTAAEFEAPMATLWIFLLFVLIIFVWFIGMLVWGFILCVIAIIRNRSSYI